MTQLAQGPLVTTQQPQQWMFTPRAKIPDQPGFADDTRALLEKPFAPHEIKNDVKRHTDGWAPVYVEASSVIKRLNDTFNSEWSFEMVGEPVLLPPNDPTQVIVRGRLTVTHQTSVHNTVKEQFGSAFLKKHSGNFVDLGSDFKAAATDALKKCATQFGIALELYNRDESPMQGMARTGDVPSQGTFPAQQANPNAPAEPFQIEAIKKMFESLGVPDGAWQQQLGFTSPAQVLQGHVQALLSGEHPWVKTLHAQRGTQSGLRATAA